MSSTLKDLCINFVIKYIYAVDSLEDFPDLLGRTLFDGSVRYHKSNLLYKNPALCNKVVTLFVNAYKQLILSEISLCQNILLLERYGSIWEKFVHVQKLHLCHCKTGDDHDIIEHIGQLKSLTDLSLRDNCLSSAAVRRFTCPLRVTGKGPKLLNYLDLSDNPQIKDDALKFIKCFTVLRKANLSNCSITSSGITFMQQVVNMVTCECNVDGCGSHTTEGWAKELVEHWRLDLQSTLETSARPRHSFYTKFDTKRLKIEAVVSHRSDRQQMLCFERSSLLPPGSEVNTKSNVGNVRGRQATNRLRDMSENDNDDLLAIYSSGNVNRTKNPLRLADMKW